MTRRNSIFEQVQTAFRDSLNYEEEEQALLDEDEEADDHGHFPPHYTRDDPCPPNPHADLPVYSTIWKIHRDLRALIDDPYSLEQLQSPRMNFLVVRPMVDQLYEMDDVSVIYCLMCNKLQFLRRHLSQGHDQSVNYTRATVCELVATKLLRKIEEDCEGPRGLLKLANILVGAFEPFQGAPQEITREFSYPNHWAVQKRGGYERKVPALEVAIVSESKAFLASPACQKVIEAIYRGRIVYTPSSFIDILPDHYKHKPVSLYNPRKAPLLNQYRLIVPRTRNFIEVCQFIILLVLYFMVMQYRFDRSLNFGLAEAAFCIYTMGWVLDQTASILEHGWQVYTQNLWSFLDVIYSIIFGIYFVLRMDGLRNNKPESSILALDILAMGGPVLIPRLAFCVMTDNMLFLSLRAMMADFTLLTLLAVWCFMGFLFAMTWLDNEVHPPVTIMKWMLWIWFGLDGSGIPGSADFHWFLGPTLMVAFAFLGNTLFITILVSMLSNTFSKIASNANAEFLFRRAVLTFESVKSDAIFAYLPPFNMLAVVFMLPLKFLLTPRWFHKVNVLAVRVLNAPLLILISLYERKTLWPDEYRSAELAARRRARMAAKRPFWDFAHLSVHHDIEAVFDSEPPQEVIDDLLEDERHLPDVLRAEFIKSPSVSAAAGATSIAGAVAGAMAAAPAAASSQKPKDSENEPPARPGIGPRRRTRVGSISSSGGITEELLEALHHGGGHDKNQKARLEALEISTRRIEHMLRKVVEAMEDNVSDSFAMDASSSRPATTMTASQRENDTLVASQVLDDAESVSPLDESNGQQDTPAVKKSSG